jgi:amino acid transporter
MKPHVTSSAHGEPQPLLGLREAIAIIVGIVIGAGIFKSPSLVAQFVGSPEWLFIAWIGGGLVSLIGALCYAELATTYPHAGGDYHFLLRAYGRRIAFLFAWARFSVITTGSIALLAFVFGDYMSQIFNLGAYSEALYALSAVIALTLVNLRGVRTGAATQVWLTSAQVIGLMLVILAGLLLLTRGLGAGNEIVVVQPAASAPGLAAFGLAMIFVLLTYGGWNEAAYISAELYGDKRNMVRALVLSIGLITALYLLVNWAYLYGLGLEGMATSNAVAADLMNVAFGRIGETLIAITVAIASLTSLNATMIVGARTNYAVGRDWRVLSFLGVWNSHGGTPRNALLAQSALAAALVLLAIAVRGGFATMVEFTAPVFWLFFLLATASLMVLRHRDPDRPRPFKVPLYPLLPVLFCGVCLYMLWSSLAYVRAGALVGVGMLVIGVILMFAVERRTQATTSSTQGIKNA